jgi:hypothetical protein
MKMLESIKAIESVATLVALVIGAIWAYIKFRKRREHAPRIEFLVDIGFVGTLNDEWLVEVQAFVDNKGLVRHVFRKFDFSLRCLYETDPIKEGGKEINYQTEIPHVIKTGSWMSGAHYIEPGLRTRYSYVATIPRTASFVLLHGRFEYEGGEYEHTADKLIKVPEEQEKANEKE